MPTDQKAWKYIRDLCNVNAGDLDKLAIIDGNRVSRAKPDPEVFTEGAKALGLSAEECIVFEDAVAGIEAAHRGGMAAVGIGTREALPQADIVTPGLDGLTVDDITARLRLAGSGV